MADRVELPFDLEAQIQKNRGSEDPRYLLTWIRPAAVGLRRGRRLPLATAASFPVLGRPLRPPIIRFEILIVFYACVSYRTPYIFPGDPDIFLRRTTCAWISILCPRGS